MCKNSNYALHYKKRKHIFGRKAGSYAIFS